MKLRKRRSGPEQEGIDWEAVKALQIKEHLEVMPHEDLLEKECTFSQKKRRPKSTWEM